MIIKKPKVIIPALAAVVLIIAASAACTFTGPKDDHAALDVLDTAHRGQP
ncbi:MAG TPA: hypothetical protein PK127_04125 [Clostridiales bacterium]|nr:hypothetical protein [Clostridiales bacterium]HPV01649.1 hypothetical protein [Clostridiales bacterium]